MIPKPKNSNFSAIISIVSSFFAFLVINFTFITLVYAAGTIPSLTKPVQASLLSSIQLPAPELGSMFGKVVAPTIKTTPKKVVRKPVKRVQLAYVSPTENIETNPVIDVPVVSLDNTNAQTNTVLTTLAAAQGSEDEVVYSSENATSELVSTSEASDDRPDRLDQYFKKYNMPLSGYGEKFVQVADDCGLDWRLLPAISIQESTGGKYMRLNNPFGWASARVGFKDFDEAIEVVGNNLCGLNPKTASYYGNKTTYQKLWSYNGTVNHAYPGHVLAIMEKF